MLLSMAYLITVAKTPCDYLTPMLPEDFAVRKYMDPFNATFRRMGDVPAIFLTA